MADEYDDEFESVSEGSQMSPDEPAKPAQGSVTDEYSSFADGQTANAAEGDDDQSVEDGDNGDDDYEDEFDNDGGTSKSEIAGQQASGVNSEGDDDDSDGFEPESVVEDGSKVTGHQASVETNYTDDDFEGAVASNDSHNDIPPTKVSDYGGLDTDFEDLPDEPAVVAPTPQPRANPIASTASEEYGSDDFEPAQASEQSAAKGKPSQYSAQSDDAEDGEDEEVDDFEAEGTADGIVSRLRRESTQQKDTIRQLKGDLHASQQEVERLTSKLKRAENAAKRRESASATSFAAADLPAEAEAHIQDLEAQVQDLTDELSEQEVRLVEQAEKTFQAAERAEKFRDKHHTLLVEIRAARNALIRGIVGDQADVSLYKHVKLPDLIRQQTEAAFAAGEHKKMRGILATIEAGSGSSSRPASRAGSVTSTARKGGTRPSPVPPHSGRSKARTGSAGAGSGGDGDESRPSTGGGENDETKRSEDAGGMDTTARSARDDADGAVSTIIEAEKEIAALRRKNLRLNDRIQELQEILEEYEGKLERMGVLQHRMERVGDQARFEKTQRERAENEIVRGEEKVEALSEHIEKLMLHLKHEAAAKAKAFEAQRRSEKELKLLQARNKTLVKKHAKKEKLVAELKEGARILEDQLRLMDEKYIELRGKLDWTRQHAQKEVKRIQGQAEALQAKWMMAQSMGAIPRNLMDTADVDQKIRDAEASMARSRRPQTEPRSAQARGTHAGRATKLQALKQQTGRGTTSTSALLAGSETRTSTLGGARGAKSQSTLPSVNVPEIEDTADNIDPSLPWSAAKLQSLTRA